MSKLNIKRQRIFAEFAGITGAIAQYGSMAAGAKAYSDDPDTIQALSAFSTGFGGGSTPPALEDMNALFYLITRQLSYFQQTGIAEWNASTTYYIGSLVNSGIDTIFMSVADNNTNNALTDTSKWVNVISRRVTTISQLSYTTTNYDRFIVNPISPTTTNRNIILPTPAASISGRVIMIKQTGATSGGSNVTLSVKAADDSLIDGSASSLIAQYTCKRYICDGTNWHTI